ncbi:putative Ig domain-containing protein, partial [Amaricoccus macauensis]|uniref:putative Ig domain-containing protein n=1 Tax=Amaricoccus macauensis TaxID=57001 RepID=UPI003C7A5DEF
MATVSVRADNLFTFYLNGVEVLSGSSWAQVYTADLDIEAGDVIALSATDTGGAGEVFVDIAYEDGTRYGSGTDWRVATSVSGDGWLQSGFDDSGWAQATSYGTASTGRLAGTGQSLPEGSEAEWIWSDQYYADNAVYLRWTVGDASGNTPPTVSNPIADQTVTVGETFNIAIPTDTFFDSDGDALSYSATLGNGDPLPAWLTFDAQTGVISGTAQNEGTATIVVTADDG